MCYLLCLKSCEGIHQSELRKTPRDLAEHFGVWLKRGVKELLRVFTW